MSSSQLALELLSLSAGISQFSNFQLINLGQQNNLFNIAPELIQFISTCGACDNRLASLFSSSLNINPLLLNLGQCNGCLSQLIDLQGLFLSGFDSNGFANDVNNGTANNETAVAEEDANANEGEANLDEGAAANETAVAEGEAAANETAVAEGDAAANETEVVDEKDAKEEKKAKVEETPSSEGRKVKKSLVQRSGATKVSKVQVLGSMGFGLVMFVGALAL